MSNGDTTISKYDRQRAALADVALFTKPTTVQNVEGITGRAETFVIRSCRADELGDFIFIECMDDSGVVRLALPPAVSNAIARQRDSLTARRRKLAGQRQAKARKDAGKLPGFMQKKA